MNNSVKTLTRLIVLLLLAVISLSMVACDKLPFDIEGIFGGVGETPDNGEMIITDETGELYVFGTYSEDGSKVLNTLNFN